MTVPVSLAEPTRISFYEDERQAYERDPFIVLTFDPPVWHGKSLRITDRGIRVPAAKALWWLTQYPWSDPNRFATHTIAEPGAPLEPVEGRAA